MEQTRVNILNVPVSAITMVDALDTIETWIARRSHHYICVTGVHGVMESQRDPALREILVGSGLTTPDGMPLVWMCRLLGFAHVERVYGPDLMLHMCERSRVTGYRHFLYGGDQQLLDALRQRLTERYPGLQIVGTYAPPFRPLTRQEDDEIVQLINAHGPDIVWVGLGTPKQEQWMAAHCGSVAAPVLVGVGAAFDFHAGRKRQAPAWMRRSGLEWLFRLGQEPRRLWRRYLVNNPVFVLRAALQLAQHVRERRTARR